MRNNIVSQGYYGIKKGKDYNPNSWHRLTDEYIAKIESNCQSYMEKLGYEKFVLSEEGNGTTTI